MLQEKSNPGKQVFISYNRTDREACIALRMALEQAGLSVFQDEDSIRVGDRWVTRLEQALQQCTAFVLLAGRDGIQRWVGAEVQVALSRHLSPHDDAQRLPIFPILLDAAQPDALPPFLKLFQADHWTPQNPLPDDLVSAILSHSIRIDSRHILEDRCPYLGLSAFTRNDAGLFFGRRQEILEALSCLGDQQGTNPEALNKSGGSVYHRWLQVEGNSGSGKSSLVQAGMLPMIEQGALWGRTGYDHWRILGPMMPGKNPVKSLQEAIINGLTGAPLERIALANKIQLEKPDALASAIKAYHTASAQTAYLLIVDQFEELFTFSEASLRKQFDSLLANALQDTNCPLFLVSTVRADFLDRFEYLPNLQAIYNRQCKRYFLPTISIKGLREVIEQPARLAGLDVQEVSAAILKDAENEIGALPLVENALTLLYQHQQQPNKLSGDYYRQLGGIAGMLSEAADRLLARIDRAVPKGKLAALELLLRLTRINGQGRHTRQRITLDEAIFVAGNGDDASGKRIIEMLSGQRDIDKLETKYQNVLRLITLNTESGQHYVDLIHETLIRAHSKDEYTSKQTGYWPALFDYIENNRDRDIYRQQLAFESKRWQQSKGIGRLWNLTYWGLNKYRALRIPRDSIEGSFLAWSRRTQAALVAIFSGVALYAAESLWWVEKHDLSLEMIWTLQRFRFGNPVLPVLTDKPIPAGTFDMGELGTAFSTNLGENGEYFGVPGKTVQITAPFHLGATEVTYKQYDYYVWQQHRQNNTQVAFPNTAKGGRGNRPVVNINWFEATAYVSWLGEQIHMQCRLPTEAEWEYAARGGTQTVYPWGDDVSKNNANCDGCGSQWDKKESAPVGSFAANAFGLYDMSGNVWEWTCSNWREQFDGSEQSCNDDINDTQYRVLRGGSWFDNPGFVRSSARSDYHPANHLGLFGFRVLCSSPIE
ncbi:Formylglycine-generating enzyme, required for sulfatase activity, contains SUMF1/FGE domain [Nitrosomonas sp. Nm51]|uniref:nSTAND1 domain-containing NTPase n=1 Tax=Nitrosomonas sp. Nm51 TaxID=133720 RepID=UPI0008D2523A|nr:SUMF1/EgtB/PvdO family nonheme iron enzyme [Nitrosomonas sp. Nm51]SER74380.1 Formylglycine-generating enzyme, required for sulfatase activity, contains SUMF1/FGE domain [Nitrosomonas sp. Nm51]